MKWGRKIFAAALTLALGSAMALSGCGSDSGASSAAAKPVSQKAEQNFKSPPGTAEVHRDANVKYSVPEGVSVLMYHMVGDLKDNSAVITEANLRMHMDFLRDHGYHPITMQELYDYVTKGAALPEKPVCITFDDGYLDSYTIVWPMMKEYGFPWTLYVITDDVGKPGNRMTWDQLKEMAQSRTVTIGSHTLSHPRLTQLKTRAEKEHEIVGANQALKYWLGIDNVWLAYPYGDYDDEVVEITKKAGIKMAVCTDSGRAHVGNFPYDLRRVYIGNEVTTARFLERLTRDNYSPV